MSQHCHTRIGTLPATFDRERGRKPMAAEAFDVAPEVVERVSAAIERRADEIVRFASELIQQPSINPDLEPNDEAEQPAQEWLRDQFTAFGSFDEIDFWEVAQNRPNVVAVRKGEGGGRSLIWSAH